MPASLLAPLAPVLLAANFFGPPIGSWSSLDAGARQNDEAEVDDTGTILAWHSQLASPATPATPPPVQPGDDASASSQPTLRDPYTPPPREPSSAEVSTQPMPAPITDASSPIDDHPVPPPSANYTPPPNDTLVAAARRRRGGKGRGGERATLFGEGGEGFGLHFDLSLKTTAVDNRAGLMMGGTFAPIIADRLQLGLTWHWLVTPQFANLGPRRFNLEYNYGGFQMGVFVVRRGFFRLMIGGVVGGGSACIDDERLNECYSKASLFAGEPEVTAIFSLLKFMRISIGGGYRFVVPQRWSGPSGQELGGPTGTIALQLGAFDQLGKNAKKIRW
jgi:hypothetical protein